MLGLSLSSPDKGAPLDARSSPPLPSSLVNFSDCRRPLVHERPPFVRRGTNTFATQIRFSPNHHLTTDPAGRALGLLD